jgi:hypothetical protein
MPAGKRPHGTKMIYLVLIVLSGDRTDSRLIFHQIRSGVNDDQPQLLVEIAVDNRVKFYSHTKALSGFETELHGDVT